MSLLERFVIQGNSTFANNRLDYLTLLISEKRLHLTSKNLKKKSKNTHELFYGLRPNAIPDQIKILFCANILKLFSSSILILEIIKHINQLMGCSYCF